jgi:hypothetical protein
MQATCRALIQQKDINFAHHLIQDRRYPIAYWRLEQFHDASPIQLFKAIPATFWMNDEESIDNTYIDIRTLVELR